MPFAKTARGVSRRFQGFGNGDLVGVKSVRIAGEENDVSRPFLEPDALRVAPGHQRRARGGADGRSHVEGSHGPALGGHAVEVRGLVDLGSEGADVAVAHVVDENEDDVGLLGSQHRATESHGNQKDAHAKSQSRKEPINRSDGYVVHFLFSNLPAGK